MSQHHPLLLCLAVLYGPINSVYRRGTGNTERYFSSSGLCCLCRERVAATSGTFQNPGNLVYLTSPSRVLFDRDERAEGKHKKSLFGPIVAPNGLYTRAATRVTDTVTVCLLLVQANFRGADSSMITFQ